MNTIKQRSVTEFFKEDKPVWAVYDATRKLPSYIDGFKNSQRKLIWVGFDKLTKDYVKTETYCNICALDTVYIHGAANLCGVCTSLVQDFIGTCNYPYFLGNDGGWGSRLINTPSAPRYTKVKLAEITNVLFNKIDNKIYEKQWFEGQYIEPKYLVPIFPTIFLNSSSGLTAGFSENIYSRNPLEIITYIVKKITGTEKPKCELKPWFKGYKGQVVFNSDTQSWETTGVIVQNNMTSYTITELPIETTYQKYIDFLNKLCDDNIIVDYEDKCNPRTNEILFEIKTTRDFTRKNDNLDSLINVFKLRRSLSEQYNCIDEYGRVKEFGNIRELLDEFISIRLKYYNIRKEYLLKTTESSLRQLVSKYLFVKGIIDKTIIVSNKKKADIISQLEQNPKIIKINNEYSYLLNMPIYTLTKEKLIELKEQIEKTKEEYKTIKSATIEEMWINDLKELKKLF